VPILGLGICPNSVWDENKMLEKNLKQRIIKKFRVHENDTGSTEVQIAILSEEIKQLTDHLKDHKQDHSSRRGLLKKVGERRRLLKYLQKENEESFADIAKKLKLKIAKKMIADEEEKKRIEEELLAKANGNLEEEEEEEETQEEEK
jgi:small subunit ribosomal protein S15